MDDAILFETTRGDSLRDAPLKDESIELIPATDDHLELLMAWRSHPEVYRYFSMQDGPLRWEDHIQFWTTRQDRNDWIICYDDGTRKRKVGSINVSGLSSETPEIGVFVGEVTLTRRGVGTRAVSIVLHWLKAQGHTCAYARVSRENEASKKFFESLGFRVLEESQQRAELTYKKQL